jgi:hypothetical protein
MAKYCIVRIDTGECVNILELDNINQWTDHAGLTLATRHDGEIGWKLLNGEWDYPVVEIDPEIAVRRRRNRLLKRYVDIINPVRWNGFSEEKKQEWIQYRQDLLDIPQQPGFPNDVVWPIKPDY